VADDGRKAKESDHVDDTRTPCGAAAAAASPGQFAGIGGLLIAAALFLAVVIANAVFIALAARSIADIGSLYITVT